MERVIERRGIGEEGGPNQYRFAILVWSGLAGLSGVLYDGDTGLVTLFLQR